MLLSLQIQAILVHCLFLHFAIQNAWLDKFSTCTKLFHRLRLVEFLLELLEGAFDVVSLFNLNAKHGIL